jgi:hypothetical protein
VGSPATVAAVAAMVVREFENPAARDPDNLRRVLAPNPLQTSSWIFRVATPGDPRMVLPHLGRVPAAKWGVRECLRAVHTSFGFSIGEAPACRFVMSVWKQGGGAYC